MSHRSLAEAARSFVNATRVLFRVGNGTGTREDVRSGGGHVDGLEAEVGAGVGGASEVGC